jgi:hypothetical protein
MTALEARKLSVEKLRNSVIQPMVDHIYNRIRAATQQGKFLIRDPFMGFSQYPSEEEKEAIFMTLKSNGYTVKDHPDPDPGDPRSRPYIEILW